MSIAAIGLMLLTFQASKTAAPPATAADRVTLRDGSIVLGQVVNPNNQGKIQLLVRRAWAQEAIPDRLKAWEAAERRDAERARAERKRRLEEWRNDRAREGDNDSLLRQIDGAIRRLEDANGVESRLLVASIDRREVVKLDRRPADIARLVRMGWRADFADVETMAPDELRQGLEGRNFAVNGDDPVSIDDLFPIAVEPEPRWRLRRAATEVKTDRSAWFVRYGDAILSDSGDGQKIDPAQMLGGLGNLTSLVRELTGEAPPPDPLPPKLKALAERGRVGAVVTKLEIATDLAGVTVEAELWVNVGPGPDTWQSAGKRTAVVNTDEVAANAGAALEADPQVKSAFQIAEGLGLGQITPEMKSRALGVGAATQKALSQVREQANADLDGLAVDLEK